MSQTAPLATDALSSWKEISTYLKCSVRSAQRFRDTSDLPIRRFGSGPRGGVIAFARDLDLWLASRPLNAGRATIMDGVPSRSETVNLILDKHRELLRELRYRVADLKASGQQSRAIRQTCDTIFSQTSGFSIRFKESRAECRQMIQSPQ